MTCPKRILLLAAVPAAITHVLAAAEAASRSSGAASTPALVLGLLILTLAVTLLVSEAAPVRDAEARTTGYPVSGTRSTRPP